MEVVAECVYFFFATMKIIYLLLLWPLLISGVAKYIIYSFRVFVFDIEKWGHKMAACFIDLGTQKLEEVDNKFCFTKAV